SEALGFGGKEEAEAFMQKAWARDASGKPSDAGAPSKAWEDIKAWIFGTPRAPVAPPAHNRNVNLTDQRTLTINVEGGADPAKTGREVGKAVDAALERDRRGTLADVGG